MYFIYWFVPNIKLNFKTKLWSTILCVVLIELSRHVFGWYISGSTSYGKFYGAYAVIVTMALWIYYSSLIILLSAELVKFILEKRGKSVIQKIINKK
jgi:membrane protein